MLLSQLQAALADLREVADAQVDYMTSVLLDETASWRGPESIETIQQVVLPVLIELFEGDEAVANQRMAALHNVLAEHGFAAASGSAVSSSDSGPTKLAAPVALSGAAPSDADAAEPLALEDDAGSGEGGSGEGEYSSDPEQQAAASKSAGGGGGSSSTAAAAGASARGRKESKRVAAAELDESMNEWAAAQVSRFHWETITSEYTEVDLKNVCIKIGPRDLLIDSNVRFVPGHRYGLVGLNGIGKSTLLKHCAAKTLIGFPPQLRVLYVDQEITGTDQSAIQIVVQAHAFREHLLKEEAALEAAVSGGAGAPPHVIALEVLAARAMDELREARMVAAKRSGHRGKLARDDELVAEANELAARTLAADARAGAVPASDHALLAETLLLEVRDKLALIDSDSAEARAAEILAGLGFSRSMQTAPTLTLSGGWRMRVALARALFMEPDLLCGDELTNHLDLPSILWLQDYLSRYEGMLVLVSHDRAFLDAVATDIIVFKDQTLRYYPGNYSAYRQTLAEATTKAETMAAAMEKKREHIRASIQHNVARAARTGDDKRLAQVTSRKRKLERMGMEKLEDGSRYKKSYHGFRTQVKIEAADPPVKFAFPNPGPLASGGALLALADVVAGYVPGAPILNGVNFGLEPGSRTVILGANGSGKSTLLQVLTGTLAPWSGHVSRLHGAGIAYYAQHHATVLDLSISAVAHLRALFPGSQDEAYRAHLGSYGLSGPVALQRMASLSGGERARVVFAAITWFAPHLLILDEPSNALDLLTMEALREAIQAYTGAVLLVSHDQYLVGAIADQPGTALYEIRKGAMVRIRDSFADWVARVRVAGGGGGGGGGGRTSPR